MPKGGAREGAGRPRGSRGKRTRFSIAKAEAFGLTPLDVLLESMLAARAEGERAEAVDYALAAAPYVHPKLAPMPAPPAPAPDDADLSLLTDEELDQLEDLLSRAHQRPPGNSATQSVAPRRGRYPPAVSSDAPGTRGGG